MEVGLRVVRGKDWKWGDQDGGEGSVGTVVEVGGQGGKIPKNTVVVVWDSGSKANYRAGHQGADDLKVLDNAVAGARHPSVTCDVCHESGLIGTRWKCEVCLDFDLCHACYMGDKHDLSHAFTRWDTAMSLGVPVPARSASRKVQAKGIYLGATVVRGTDWNYKKQDGGPDKQGVVQSIGGSSEGSSWRSWVKVKWDSGGANDYHRGHDGKVDVKCVKAAAGETYYVDHLACLADYADSVFCSGDRVKLNESQILDAHKDQLSEFLGKVGEVIVDKDSQRLYIRFPGEDKVLRLPSAYLKKVKNFHKGDTVMISNDMQKVIRLQSGHGPWNDQMKLCLGMEAQVLGTDSDGGIKVAVNGRNWIFNPDVCTLLTRGSDDTDDDDDLKVDNSDPTPTLEETVAKLLTPESLVKLAAEGNLNAVQSIINNHPSQVDIKNQGTTALQMAACQGHLQIVIALVNAGASLAIQDKDGDNALHCATMGGEPEILEFLVKHEPNLVNSRNNVDMTCLHQAVVKQFPECIEVLLKYNADVNLQDKDGDTALHFAVGKPNTDIQYQLINHPKADIALINGKGFNIIHTATLENNISALNMLIQKAPTLVNVADTMDLAALHLAIIYAYRNAAEVLINTGKADIDVNVRGSFTPLQLAVDRGCYSMIEFLVSKGANLNAKDRNGDTALHLAARSLRQATSFATFTLFEYAKKLKDLDDAPAIAKIYSVLPSSVQKHGTWIAICCFLLQNGAQMDIQNDSGKSPENMIGDNMIKQILKRYASRTPVQVSQTQTPIHAQSSRPVGVPSTPIGPKCLMCLTADSDMTFYPCGHKITCNQCSGGMKTCFSCNEKIQEKVRSPGTLSPPSPSPPSPSPKCMMCLTADPDMTFYPCGHKVTCSQCSGGMKTCFSCNERIQEKVRSPATDPADPVIRRSQELTSNNKSSPETLRRSKVVTDPFNCPLCNSRIRNVVFLCGHSCCKECSEPLTSCHVCAQVISRKLTLM